MSTASGKPEMPSSKGKKESFVLDRNQILTAVVAATIGGVCAVIATIDISPFLQLSRL